MKYSIQERAECIGTFRWIEIQLMELLARWVPTTPEMEVKILFGRHVWDCAQHADQFGKRAFELRAPLHYTLPAAPAFRDWLADIAALSPTKDRVHTFYSMICPAMDEQYRDYISRTDLLMDEPTVRIVQAVLLDHKRMAADCQRLAGDATRVELPTPDIRPWRQDAWAPTGVVAHSTDSRRARGVSA